MFSFEEYRSADTIIAKKVIDQLNRKNFLNDKQYEFRSALSMADILVVISHRINEVLVNMHRKDDPVRHFKGLLIRCGIKDGRTVDFKCT